jgi:ketol-acid reductoisomerase
MRYSVSDTAEWGDYASGERVVGEAARAEMKKILDEIRSGAFAKAWIAENEAGRPRFEARRRSEREQLLERVGIHLRQLMPFLDPVTVRPGD